jgi:hypothetical protein
MSKQVDQQATQSTKDVRNLIAKIHRAIEEREKGLVNHIEHIRQTKLQALKTQSDGLEVSLSSVKNSIEFTGK